MASSRNNIGLNDIKILKTVDDIHNIKSMWEKLQWHPDGDHDRFIEMLKRRQEIRRPHVVAVYQDEEARAILAGRIEEIAWKFKFGYTTIFSKKVLSLTVGYGGILGDLTDDISELLAQVIQNVLKDGNADIVFLQNLGTESRLYRLLADDKIKKINILATAPSKHWTMALPGTYEEYFQTVSKNVRKNIKNYVNRLTKKYGANVSIKCFQTIRDLDDALRDIEAIACKTYHRGMGVGFIADEKTRQSIEKAMNRGIHRSYVLYIDEKPVTFWSGTQYGSVFYMGSTGYLPEYREDHIGTILLHRVIEDLCKDEGINKVDFGLGDSEYKKILCNESFEEATVYLFANTTRGIMISQLSRYLMKAEHYSRRVLKKYNLENRVKQLWRKRLIKK